MPPKSVSASRPGAMKPEPSVMTWGRALFVLVLAGIFDALRAFFNFFWFFGPALLAAYCASKVGDIWLVGGLATQACVAAAAAAGVAGVEVTGPIGVVMADAIGLIGFLTLGLVIIMTNRQLFKTAVTAPAWFVSAFAFGEVPFLGALPVFTIVVWRLYRTQIKAEKAIHQTWEAENAAELQRKRDERVAQVMQMQALQAAQMEEAANDESYAEEEQVEAANDEQYQEIPAGMRKAA